MTNIASFQPAPTVRFSSLEPSQRQSDRPFPISSPSTPIQFSSHRKPLALVAIAAALLAGCGNNTQREIETQPETEEISFSISPLQLCDIQSTPIEASSEKAEQLAAWAESQVGINETDNPDIVLGYTQGEKRDWGWGTEFISHGLAESTGESPFGHQVYHGNVLIWAQEHNKFIGKDDSPRVGDLAVIKNRNPYTGASLQIVTNVDEANGCLESVQGNYFGQVVTHQYPIDHDRVIGFIRLSD